VAKPAFTISGTADNFAPDSGRPAGLCWAAHADPNRKFDLTSPGANNGHLPVAYSTTSSARATIDCGIVKPSASRF
jgi:hypothetical protein